jgi:hypothetical protein
MYATINYAVSDLRIFTESKLNVKLQNFKNSFLKRTNVHCETSERILLGDNTGGMAFMQLPIRFQSAGAWISTAHPSVYIYTGS